jgi:hypothetical protein
MKYVIAGIASIIVAAAAYAEQPRRDSIVCVVNGEVITVRELDEFVNVMRFKIGMDIPNPEEAEKVFVEEKKTALDKMIEDRLVAAEAKKRSYEVKPDQLEKRLDAFRKQFKDESEFETELVRRGINLVLLKQKLTSQILMQQLVRDEVREKVMIAPNEISAFYQAHQQDFMLPVGIEYRAVVSKDETEARAAYGVLSQASDLEVALVAYAKSIKSGKADQANALAELAPLFVTDAPKINAPIFLGGEWYVFVVDVRHDARQQPLSEAIDMIRNRIYESKFEKRFDEFVAKLKKDAVIQKKSASAGY